MSRLPLYAVFGHPITHSLSPAIHNHAFLELHRQAHYLPVDVMPENLSESLAAFHMLGGRGVNLTRPLKEHVVSLVRGQSHWVDRSGAANTLSWNDGGWLGENTDCEALYRLLPEGRGETALVLGSGGVARASWAVLDTLGYQVVVASRRPAACHWAERVVTWDRAVQIPDLAVVINATPLGQMGEATLSEWPLPRPDGIAVDWVYRPTRTDFLEAARASSTAMSTLDGLTLFIEQAALAWRPWFGHEGPRESLWKAVLRWS